MHRSSPLSIIGAPLVVILLSGCLALSQAAQPPGNTTDAKKAMAMADLYTFSGVIQQFKIDCDRYPTTKEGLKTLRMCQPGLESKWRGPYVTKLPKDPWGHGYTYQWPGGKGKQGFTVSSGGPAKGQEIVVDGPVH